MSVDLPPLHADLSFNSPLSDERVSRIITSLGDLGSARIVDAGCGWAELLLRILAANPHATGIGIDTDAGALVHGRSNAKERGLEGRVGLVDGDAAQSFPSSADVVVCCGSGHVWGRHDTALDAIRDRLAPGAQVIFGDGIWSTTPSERVLTALRTTADEMPTLGDLVDAAVAAGFRPLEVGEATQQEWDAFESGYSRGYEHWLISHEASDPDYSDIQTQADAHRRAYLTGYRGVFGFAYLHLIAV